MSNGKRKGSSWERWACVRLSEWWTGGSRSDCFWRTAGSGSRATTRGRKGKDTAGAYGDVAATDHEGIPLLAFMAIELKRGYTRQTIQDLIDKPTKAAIQPYETWIMQAEDACKLSGSFGWVVVFRRDRRDALIMLPNGLVAQLRSMGSMIPTPVPWLGATVPVKGHLHHVALLRLESFFESVSPEHVRALAARL